MIEKLDQALTDDDWWGAMMTLDQLTCNVLLAIEWTKSCPCHWFGFESDWSTVPAHVRAAWSRCPMAGRRMPEVSAGDWIALFKTLCAVSAVKLSLDLPSAIRSSRRAEYLAEFERGRGYLVFVLVLKNIQLRDAPSVLMALGHHDESVAKAFLEQCLVTSSTHPRMVQLQSHAMSEEAVSWLAGESLDFCPNLASFTGSYRFGWSNETRCEGQHAYIGRSVSHLYNRSEAYDSLVLRLPFFRSLMQGASKQGSEEVALKLTECLHTARNPKTLVATLCLQKHPLIELLS